MKYTATNTQVCVHPEGEGILTERGTTISVADEGAGAFVKLTQSNDWHKEGQCIALDTDELEAVFAAAKMLLDQPELKP